MAAPSKVWVIIADSQVDADSPGDTTLITGFRDNLEHLEEWLGMSYTAAQNHSHNGTDSALVSSVADGAITLAKLYPANYTVGDQLKQYHDSVTTTNSQQVPVKVKEITIQKGGTFRIKADIKNDNAGGFTWIEFRKNDVTFGAWLSNQGLSYVTKSQDLGTWAAGDRIGLYMYKDGGTSAYVKNFRLYAAEDELEFSNTF